MTLLARWINKLKALFVHEEIEEEEMVMPTEKNNFQHKQITAKMTYQYPKQRNYRFPVIPDEPPGKRTGLDTRPTSDEKSRIQPRDRRRRERNLDYKERKVYKKDKKPFVPTEVPSPIYGFQKREENKKIENTPAFERRKQKIESNQETTSPEKQEQIQEQINEQLDVASSMEQNNTKSFITQPDKLHHTEEAAATTLDAETELENDGTTVDKQEPSVTNELNNPKLSKDHVSNNKHNRQDVNTQKEQPAIIWRQPKRRAIPYHLLNDPIETNNDEEWIKKQQRLLEETLKHFKVRAKVVNATQGPSVTRFEVQPDLGVKVSKIKNLSDDLKLNMAAKDIRIEAPIPGKNTVGIEIPNEHPQTVTLQSIFDTDAFKESTSPLSIALGVTIEGEPKVTNIQKMPHGLIAGATGSGKSVCINAILISLLYKASHEDVKFLLIDPKMVELAPYNGIPHLVSPVITDVKAANQALKWAVNEMEERYEKLAQEGVRDIDRYNQKMVKEKRLDEKMPYIVIVIDELADLMMVSPQDVENSISRIAQKARACGIHLLLATQRPSVDVITGLIKSNIPTRIAFSVSSQVDSRTIIDSSGAEKLLGKGDMLFMENGARRIIRLQGPFVSDEEIERITTYARSIAEPEYLFEQEQLLEQLETHEEEDELMDEVIDFVVHQQSASTSLLQRRFKIGYNRAARLMDSLEARGIISGQDGSKPRDVLVTPNQLEETKKL